MEGFKDTNYASKAKMDTLTGMMVLYPVNPRKENEIMEKAGFIIDRENRIYVMEGFGAFRTNVDKEIKTIDDLRSYKNTCFKRNPYSEIIRLIDEEGYEFVLGPGAPGESGNDFGLSGLYCKNYKEIIAKQKAARLQKEQNER